MKKKIECPHCHNKYLRKNYIWQEAKDFESDSVWALCPHCHEIHPQLGLEEDGRKRDISVTK